MPKYYCDYCDTHLTHDSPSVRKTHCSGRKHRDNVRNYYQKWMEEQAQRLIDKTTAAFKTKSNKLDINTLSAVPPPNFGFSMPPPNFNIPPPTLRPPTVINQQTYMGATNMTGLNATIGGNILNMPIGMNVAPPPPQQSGIPTGVPPPMNFNQLHKPITMPPPPPLQQQQQQPMQQAFNGVASFNQLQLKMKNF